MKNNYQAIAMDKDESSSLIQHNKRLENNKTQSFPTKLVAGILLFGAAICGAYITGSSYISSSSNLSNNDIKLSTSTGDKMIILGSNSYIERDGPIGSDYPWSQDNVILEPHRSSSLKVSNYVSGCQYDWVVDDTTYSNSDHLTELVFKTVKDIPVTVVETCDGVTTRTSDFTIYVRYVRRELRSLTDEDRNKYIDAAQLMYSLSTEDGRELYGMKYKDINYFVRLHLTSAGRRTCDEFHDGLGFLNHHIALTLEYEQALQAIDGSIALPYWDYTVEAHNAYQHDGNVDYWHSESPIFDDDWFGEYAPDNDDKTVTSGRWAYTPIMTDAWNFSEVYNSYGLMRSMWNTNKIPYVTRTSETYGYLTSRFPKCNEVKEQMSIDNWADFGINAMYGPHGTIHNMIAGQWGRDYRSYKESMCSMADVIDQFSTICTDDAIDTYELFVASNPKGLWMKNELECPEYCSADTAQEDCQCTCVGVDYSLYKNEYDLLEKKGILELIAKSDPLHKYFSYDKSAPDGKKFGIKGFDEQPSVEAAMKLYYELQCNPGLQGTMLDSGAPAEPLFWPTHPFLDKLWHWKRLSPYPYEFVWEDGSSYSENCDGHDLSSVLLWKNLFDEDDHYYTNEELNNAFDPTQSLNTYIYDNFEWTGCLEEGYDIRQYWL